jgi:hypothetical protein
VADGVFNIAKGRIAYYASLPATSDALVLVLLKATGLEADDTLNNYDDLASLLAASNDEADATNYTRKTVTSGVTVTVDDTANRVDVDMPDQTWAALGGASNNSIGKLLVCYDPDTTSGTDSSVIPLTYHDCTLTTDGTDVTVTIAAAGFARAS